MAKDKFIKGAIKRPGALTAKAKASGKSISDYCAQANLTTLSKQECNFAKRLRSFK